jgi:hypothetical protein
MQLTLDPGHLVDRLDHVHRDADGPRLISDRPRDRLPDPPGRVRGELVALGVVELLDRANQAEIAFLNQVEEDKAAADVAFGDRYHEPEIRLDQPLLRSDAVRGDQHQLCHPCTSTVTVQSALHLLLGEQASLDRFR